MTRSTTRLPTSPTLFTTSADGTRIAYETAGSGPVLVLVDGALCQRTMGPSRDLAAVLADRFSTVCYDRRGRGESDPGASPYAVEREIEDLAAVIAAAGGRAAVFGSSSGAALSLEAARAGVAIDHLVLYEAPFVVDDTHAADDPALPDRLRAMVGQGRRGQAVKTFLRGVGAPAPMVALMPLLPVWRRLTAVAHTLPYDLAIVVPFRQGEPLPTGRYAEVTAPTLVIAGGKSPVSMRNAQAAIAEQLPHGSLVELPGQTHMIRAKATGPVVAEFLSREE